MGLQETRDRAVIVERLDALLAADPVRNTVLGTVRADLADPWAVLAPASIATRSQIVYPIALSTGWDAAGLAELAPLVGRQPRPAVSGPAAMVDALIATLGREPAVYHPERLFRLDELRPPLGVAGRAVLAGPHHEPLLVDWISAFMCEAGIEQSDVAGYVAEAVGRAGVWLWLDAGEVPVATAFRRPVAAGSARIGPVYTPPEQRGHGYGSAVTAAATEEILDLAAVPVLFTDLANPTSNKIYAALGYTAVEDRCYARFAD